MWNLLVPANLCTQFTWLYNLILIYWRKKYLEENEQWRKLNFICGGKGNLFLGGKRSRPNIGNRSRIMYNKLLREFFFYYHVLLFNAKRLEKKSVALLLTFFYTDCTATSWNGREDFRRVREKKIRSRRRIRRMIA